MPLEHGQREIARVAIAVVESQRGETRAALDEPSPRFRERDEFETETTGEAERLVEKFRRDFEQTVRREAGRRRFPRAHAVKRQDDALPARRRRQRLVQAAGAEGREAGVDEEFL